MKKEDNRVRMTKRVIKEALMRCLDTKSLSRVSISELCREAEINRGTFYNHYESPADVLAEIGWDYAENIKKIFLKGDPPDEKLVRERMTECFVYIYEDKVQIRKIFKENTADRYLSDTFRDIFTWAWTNIIDIKKKLNLTEAEYDLAVTAYGWSAYHMINRWICDGVEIDPAGMTELFLKLSGNSLFSVS